MKSGDTVKELYLSEVYRRMEGDVKEEALEDLVDFFKQAKSRGVVITKLELYGE